MARNLIVPEDVDERRTGLASGGASNWVEEDDPGAEVISERLETVGRTRGYEQEITRTEGDSLIAAPERARARDDEIDLVAVVRLLAIHPAWGEQLHNDVAPLEQRHGRNGRPSKPGRRRVKSYA